jgi:ribosomal-protein-alanine N-acetyltransferase
MTSYVTVRSGPTNMTGMTVCTIERIVNPDQLDGILEIERESFTNPWTRDMYLTELGNEGVSYVYAAKDAGGRMLGFCSFWRIFDELHINNLAVAPAHRRTGVGAALLERALQEGAALGATRATLEVRRSNDVARRLYERFGFAVAGVRRGYYTHPLEDALVLWRHGLVKSGTS